MHIDTHIDGHIHTSMCNHAVGTMEEYVQSAIDKGLQKIVFLEHLEEGIDYFQRTWLTDDEFDYYFSEGTRLRNIYADRVEIGLGVEVGYNPECSERIIKRLQKHTWDRVGISYHYCRLEPGKDHLNLLSRKQRNIDRFSEYGAEDLLSRYLETLIEAVGILPGNVLCHLDAGLRYHPHLEFNSPHRQQVAQLLALVKQKGMALEINTSGYPIRNTPFPAPFIIKQALEAGITLVAGSDAHRPQDIGRHFDKLPALIEKIT